MATIDEIKKGSVADMALAATPFAAAFRSLYKESVEDQKKMLQSFLPLDDAAAWTKWCDKVVAQGWIDADTGELLKGVNNYDFMMKVVARALIPIQMFFSAVSMGMESARLDMAYDSFSKTTPHPAPVDALVRSMILDPARANENRAQLKRHGFSDSQIDNIILSHYASYDVGTIRDLYLRGAIGKDKMYERMRELGFTDTRTGEIIKTWELIPPVNDLIHMSVRETFSPEIAQKFGQFEGQPAAFTEWAAKQGLSAYWAGNYWAAHWELPSVTMGFEMLHRGVIDKPTLELLLKAQDVMPYWRDKLTAISYNPYTRVDVRRMHDFGVIDDAGLLKAYMDIGYDKEHASKLAEFTIKYNEGEGRELTRSAILEAWRDDLTDRATTKELLKSQGYNDDLADFYIELEQFRKDQQTLKLQIDNIEAEYLSSIASATQTRDRLGKLGLRGNKIDALMDSFSLKLYNYQAIPSRSDIDDMYIRGIITKDQWSQTMHRHGYAADHIDWLHQALEPQRIFKGRAPSRTDVEDWYKKGIVNDGQWTEYMKGLGYSDLIIDKFRREH